MFTKKYMYLLYVKNILIRNENTESRNAVISIYESLISHNIRLMRCVYPNSYLNTNMYHQI